MPGTAKIGGACMLPNVQVGTPVAVHITLDQSIGKADRSHLLLCSAFFAPVLKRRRLITSEGVYGFAEDTTHADTTERRSGPS
jgi:hypothetical protein